MEDRIRQLLDAAPGAEFIDLAQTDWFDDPADAERAIADFTPVYESHAAAISAILGPPSMDEQTHRDDIDEWYPEAIRLSGWHSSDRLLHLALVQHDRETPVAISLGCYTLQEIEDLRA